ncbi:MAG: hypothetical protein ACYDC5_03535 [Candidatus Dormibacteria bacterium]
MSRGACLSGRDFVVQEDIQEMAVPSLAHRLTLRPELWAQRIRPADIISECLQAVPVPPTLSATMLSGTQNGQGQEAPDIPNWHCPSQLPEYHWHSSGPRVQIRPVGRRRLAEQTSARPSTQRHFDARSRPRAHAGVL